MDREERERIARALREQAERNMKHAFANDTPHFTTHERIGWVREYLDAVRLGEELLKDLSQLEYEAIEALEIQLDEARAQRELIIRVHEEYKASHNRLLPEVGALRRVLRDLLKACGSIKPGNPVPFEGAPELINAMIAAKEALGGEPEGG